MIAIRPRRRSGGIVLILVLLGLIFVAALMAYVFNLGQQTQTRTMLQNAADAGAVSGPGMVARSFNTIAMNNVGITNLLGIINNLDPMPRTVTNTLLDQEAVLTSLDTQLGTGIPEPLLRTELETLRDEVAQEVTDLQAMDAVFVAHDVTAITHTPNGTAWQAISALDSWSQATAENLSTISQTAAVAAVEANLSRRVEASGVMLPAEPTWPIARGEWQDFELPTRVGFTGPAALYTDLVNDRATGQEIDWWHEHRGPYDTLYGWRDGIYQVELLEIDGGAGAGAGASGWSGRGLDNGSWTVLSAALEGYATFGPHVALQRHLSGGGDSLAIIDRRSDGTATGILTHRLINPLSGTQRTPDLAVGDRTPRSSRGRLHSSLYWSRIDNWHRTLVEAKWAMLFGGRLEDQINEPDWITSYTQVRSAAERNPSTIQETCYVRVIIRSEYHNNALVAGPQVTDTNVFWVNGYWPNPSGLDTGDRIANYIWQDDIEDESIVTGDNGQQTQVRVVYSNYYVWIGANQGIDVEILNPYTDFDEDSAPSPIDFVHEERASGSDNVYADLRFLTIAGQETASELMPTRFDRRRPNPNAIAISQSLVFNNHSDDLWTQMWRVQLEPIVEYDGWVTQMADDLPALSDQPAVNPTVAEWLQTQMQASTAAAEVMLRH